MTAERASESIMEELLNVRIVGYRRADGQVGIRNRLLVLFTVVCAEEISRRIAWQLDDAVVAGWRDCMTHPGAQRKMLRLAANPNIGAVLVMSLGCECSDAPGIAAEIAKTGKPVELVSIQAEGGTKRAIARGVELGRAMLALPVERTEVGLADLIVGVECGGSDTTSGIAANPAVGIASDLIVKAGGTVIFEETNELLGCEASLVQQAATPEVADEILAAIDAARAWGERTDQRAISAGNIEGGLTTIEEKSLGAVCKAGSTPVIGVLHGGAWERPSGIGLHLLAPYYVQDEGCTGGGTISDPNGVTELAACGAHIVVFTTGRGTVTGSGIVPVIKVCGNPETFARMQENMDINAGSIVTGERTVNEVGHEILEAIIRTGQGDLTKAEDLGHFEFHI
jgi:altronate dehydratase large subunit